MENLTISYVYNTVMSLKAKYIDIDDYHFVIPLKELELGVRWIVFVIIISNKRNSLVEIKSNF
jgi:hypothetical protein